jgi:hypothetical protein
MTGSISNLNGHEARPIIRGGTTTCFVTWILCLLSLSLPSPASSQQPLPPPSLYLGPVHVGQIRGDLYLQDGQAPACDLRVSVNAHDHYDVTVGFVNSTLTERAVGMGSSLPLALRPNVRHYGNLGSYQRVRIHFGLEIDGVRVGTPVSNLDITIHLPPHLPGVVRSNPPLIAEPDPDGYGYIYRIKENDALLTELFLDYNCSPASRNGTPTAVRIEKHIHPICATPSDSLEVELVVTNLGNDPVDGVQVTSRFDSWIFEPLESGFTYQPGPADHPFLVMEHTISTLNPGNTVTVRFYLRLKRSVNSYGMIPTTAGNTAGLLGVSDIIEINP